MYHQTPHMIPLSSLMGMHPQFMPPQHTYGFPQMPMAMSPFAMKPPMFHQPRFQSNYASPQPNLPAITNTSSNYTSIMDAVTSNNAQVGECVIVNGLTYVIRKTGSDGYATRV